MAGPPDASGKTFAPNGAEVDNGILRELGTGGGVLADPAKAYKARTVREAVDKIEAKLKPGDCIKSLTFVGHGDGGDISVGAGINVDSLVRDNHIDGREQDWQRPLRRLCDNFCKDVPEIEILLLGCNTGVCLAGSRKLFQMATFFRDCTAPKGNKNRFCVRGTKQFVSAQDVKDAVVSGKRDIFVSVCAGGPDDPKAAPDCLAERTKDGLKPRRRLGRGKQDREAGRDRLPRLDAEEFLAVAFRRPERVARPYLPTSLMVPPPISPADFLAFFDWSQSFEFRGLPAHINGEAVFVRPDFTEERIPITGGFIGLVLDAGEDRHLFVLRDLGNADVVRDLVLTDPAPYAEPV